MSRLFEALSNVEAKRRSPSEVSLKNAPAEEVRQDTTVVESVLAQPAQEFKGEHQSPEVVPLTEGSPDVIAHGMTAVSPIRTEPKYEGRELNEVLPQPVE